MSRRISSFIVTCAALGLAVPAGAATFFSDKAAFLAATAATQATTAYADHGATHLSHLTSGSVTISEYDVASYFFSGAWTTRLPGNDLAITGKENLNVALAAPVRALGFDFVEPQHDPNVNGVFQDSTFTVTFLNGTTAVDSFTFNAPNDVATFVGASSAWAFDRVQIRETIGGAENEFFGQFYTSAQLPAGAVPEPASWALMLGGFGLVGSALRSSRKQASAVSFG